jgi:hypothetical protein
VDDDAALVGGPPFGVLRIDERHVRRLEKRLGQPWCVLRVVRSSQDVLVWAGIPAPISMEPMVPASVSAWGCEGAVQGGAGRRLGDVPRWLSRRPRCPEDDAAQSTR